ncbi:MAG: discoidin domain-containing protein [Spirochaetes bacterium]|nr:discoidin domain-containing protein [Spirochaetota bacterium]
MKKLLFLLAISLMILGPEALGAKVKKATQKDIAKVFASSAIEQNFEKNAFDGDISTRWESEWQVDPSWIAIELKKKMVIVAIEIKWEWAAGAVYQIETSDNGKDWKKVVKIQDGEDNEERSIKFPKPVTTKYLRILGEERTNEEYGYSIFEVKLNPDVLDASVKDDVKIVNVESSSNQEQEGHDFNVGLAIDGNMETRWSSDFSDPQWLMVELENKTKIKAVEISWEQASAKDYKIQVSNNKNKWKDVAKIENAPGGEKRLITFDPVETKYVRMYGEKRNGEWGYSIWEIKVYK